MAIFYPTLEKIQQFKVQPTEGEWTLLNFLQTNLDDTFEIYFNPYLNGDRPDVIIMRQNYGVLIIEVKDWDLSNFSLNEKKKWVYTPNGSIVKSPVEQVLRYKNNLYDLHVDDLLEMKINDYRKFHIVCCAVYFHCASQSQVERMLVDPYKEDIGYMTFLKYNMDLIGSDGLNKDNFQSLLIRRHLIAKYPSWLFTDKLYGNFKRLLSPSIHLQNQGICYHYNDKQRDIIYSDNLEQRVKGVFGSGKTTALAARAAQAYKRALKRNTNPRILILTFNITLKNFIHDKLNQVNETFPLGSFVITNYHQFINAELNNLNIEIVVPEDLPETEVSRYLERNYYGNLQLFKDRQDDIVKYDAVLIDEIQDYHRPWMEIIKTCFRDPEGDYVLFGDVKQNIYSQKTENKDVVTNVYGVNELKYCYRSDFKIMELARAFQTDVFRDKYDIDDFTDGGDDYFFGQKQEKEGYINYMYLQNQNYITALYTIIRGNITNKEKNISPNDITILGFSTDMLRMFDAYYRYASREKTNSMMETYEMMYITHLNYIGKNQNDNPNAAWFKNLSEHLQKKLFPQRNILSDGDIIKLRQHIAKLFTINNLSQKFSSTFDEHLLQECEKCGITIDVFRAFLANHKDQLEAFEKEVFTDDYKTIRDNKKLHFWMNSGTIKISTINSFKGWESEAVFLILEPKYDTDTQFNEAFNELIYTGITRCRRNLVVINFGNAEYDKILRPLFEKFK